MGKASHIHCAACGLPLVYLRSFAAYTVYCDPCWDRLGLEGDKF